MPRSPMPFFNAPIRAFTNPWRSLANLYSAFSERSPCARATAISFGSSTFNSCSGGLFSSFFFFFFFLWVFYVQLVLEGVDLFLELLLDRLEWVFGHGRRSLIRYQAVPEPAFAAVIIDGRELRRQARFGFSAYF